MAAAWGPFGLASKVVAAADLSPADGIKTSGRAILMTHIYI